MENQQQVQQEDEGISLGAIFRLLLSKIKLLIVVLLAGVVVGGGFAFLKTNNVNYYGSSIEFYVNPEKPKDSNNDNNSKYGVYGAYGRHVMDNMVKLLASESFAEQMLLNGEILPADINSWMTAEENQKYEIGKKRQDAQTEVEKLAAKQAELDAAIEEKNEKTLALADANKAYNKAYKTLNDEWYYWWSNGYKDTFDVSSFSKPIYDDLTVGVNQLDNVKFKNLHDYVSVWSAAKEAQEAAEETLEITTDEVDTLKKQRDAIKETTDEAVETALIAWRNTKKYQEELVRYSKAVQFTYLQGDEDIEDANNLARSFIYVKISVLNDDDFAKEVLEKIKFIVPQYIEANMTIPTGYEGTNCQRITRNDDIVLTNPGYMINQMIKYAFLLGIAALLVACVVIVVIDRSDKRLRDTTDITTELNVPLLGVIPSMEQAENQKNEEDEK